MAIYCVTMIEDYPLDSRNLLGIGVIERGVTRQIELTDAQVESLRGRGIEVQKPRPAWRTPLPVPIVDDVEPVEPAEEA